MPFRERSDGSTEFLAGSSRILTYLFWGMLICLALHFCLYIDYAARIAVFPYEIDSGEGLSLHRAMLLSNGKNIYTPIDAPPYTVANYPPLFDLVFAGLLKFWGPRLLIGRLVSIFSAMAAGVFIALIIWLQTGKKLSSAIGGLFFFSSGWVTSWSVLCRVDMLALMFSLAGLGFFIGATKRSRNTLIFLAILCFIAALFTRQSAVSAPIACTAALMLCRRNVHAPPKEGAVPLPLKNRYRQGICFLVSLSGGALVIAGCLVAVFGTPFWHHVVTYTAGYVSLPLFFNWFKPFLWTHLLALLISAGYVMIGCRKKNVSACGLYWILALLTSVTAGKVGASINYFVEAWAASCVITGLVAANMEGSRIELKNPLVTYVTVGLLVMQLFQLNRFMDRTTPSPDDLAAGQVVNRLVHDATGDILSEYSGYLALNDRLLYFQPFSMSQLAHRGLWDQTVLLKDIAQKRFALVIMSTYGPLWGRWTTEMADMIQKHYQPIRHVSCFELHSFHHSKISLIVFAPRR